MSIASFSDPGVIKRRVILNSAYLRHEKTIRINHLGFIKKTKVCETCNIIKPFRSHHCTDCDNCVERFDHHCPWLGNCIAKRNYKFFYLFIFILNLLCFYQIAFSLIHIINASEKFIEEEEKRGDRNNKVYNNSDSNFNTTAIPVSNVLIQSEGSCIVSIFVIIFSLITMAFVTALFVYHNILICRNLTTKEELRKTFYTPYGNPYNNSLGLHIKRIFCAKISIFTILDEFRRNKFFRKDEIEFEDKLSNNDNRYNNSHDKNAKFQVQVYNYENKDHDDNHEDYNSHSNFNFKNNKEKFCYEFDNNCNNSHRGNLNQECKLNGEEKFVNFEFDNNSVSPSEKKKLNYTSSHTTYREDIQSLNFKNCKMNGISYTNYTNYNNGNNNTHNMTTFINNSYNNPDVLRRSRLVNLTIEEDEDQEEQEGKINENTNSIDQEENQIDSSGINPQSSNSEYNNVVDVEFINVKFHDSDDNVDYNSKYKMRFVNKNVDADLKNRKINFDNRFVNDNKNSNEFCMTLESVKKEQIIQDICNFDLNK